MDKHVRTPTLIRLFTIALLLCSLAGCASRPPIQIEYLGAKITVEGSEKR